MRVPGGWDNLLEIGRSTGPYHRKNCKTQTKSVVSRQVDQDRGPVYADKIGKHLYRINKKLERMHLFLISYRQHRLPLLKKSSWAKSAPCCVVVFVQRGAIRFPVCLCCLYTVIYRETAVPCPLLVANDAAAGSTGHASTQRP